MRKVLVGAVLALVLAVAVVVIALGSQPKVLVTRENGIPTVACSPGVTSYDLHHGCYTSP